jgi:hypothetical protein
LKGNNFKNETFSIFFWVFNTHNSFLFVFTCVGIHVPQPYFFSQDPDYITVKERVSAYCATGKEATGVATIDIAVETLRVAEYLTPTIQEQLA